MLQVVKNVQSLGGDSYICTLTISGEDVVFVSNPNDPYGLGPEVRGRIAVGDFEGEITEYVPPEPEPE
jgi:hypothetical protein